MFETPVLKRPECAASEYVAALVDRDELKPTEHINEGRMIALAKHIERQGHWSKPILIEESSRAIMDGHHRFHAAKLLKLAKLPCLMLSYDDPNLHVVSWAGGLPFNPDKIMQAAESGNLLDFKTTKHTFSGEIVFSSQPLEALR